MPDNAAQLERQNAALTLELLAWIVSSRRTYENALETWRSSCPRHTIWEDAIEAGLVEMGPSRRIHLTAAGWARLSRQDHHGQGSDGSRQRHE
jgi:hypothetical protein